MTEASKKNLVERDPAGNRAEVKCRFHGRTDKEVARMRRLAIGRQRARKGALSATNGRPGISRSGYLANPSCLMGIPRLERTHAGGKISFGSSALSALAATLVEIDLASESDWIAAGKLPAALVDSCAPPVLERSRASRALPSISSFRSP